MGSKIKGFFTGLWHLLKPEAEAAIEAFERKITPDVLQLAHDGIEFVAASGLRDSAARDAAIARMTSEAPKLGVDIVLFAKSELNALVELVYLAYKPAAPTPITPVV